MAAEELITLFDLFWFHHAVFAGKSLLQIEHVTRSSKAPETKTRRSQSPVMQVIQVRSQSEYVLRLNFPSPETSFSTGLISENTKLQTILSGKVTEFPEEGGGREPAEFSEKKKPGAGGDENKRRKRRGRGLSKSLSDLEFEELKGFMDLGFVFSEEDKNSSLASIIPGLQRLGRKAGEKEEEKEDDREKKTNESMVSRPYLSEAWEAVDQEIEKSILMKWRVPALGASANEIDMKDHLRSWAHTVASTVR